MSYRTKQKHGIEAIYFPYGAKVVVDDVEYDVPEAHYFVAIDEEQYEVISADEFDDKYELDAPEWTFAPYVPPEPAPYPTWEPSRYIVTCTAEPKKVLS